MEIVQIITQLEEQGRYDVSGEIQALQSIYGDDSIQVHEQVPQRDHDPTTRYDIETTLTPPFDEITVRLCASIPDRYPLEVVPQIQLLSRYIGNFGIDSELFGAVTRTFISNTGVLWSPGDVVIFDGIENVRSLVTKWYESKLSEAKIGSLAREEEELQRTRLKNVDSQPIQFSPPRSSSSPIELPDGVNIIQGEPIYDRGSSFVGRVCHIDHPSQVPLILDFLRADRRIARAAHPTINAWRCDVGGVLHQDNDDDGETAAGSRLAHLLQILELDNVLIVVTRYFGGSLLGPDRFKHINQCARDALELGGFLADDKVARKSRKRAK